MIKNTVKYFLLFCILNLLNNEYSLFENANDISKNMLKTKGIVILKLFNVGKNNKDSKNKIVKYKINFSFFDFSFFVISLIKMYNEKMNKIESITLNFTKNLWNVSRKSAFNVKEAVSGKLVLNCW